MAPVLGRWTELNRTSDDHPTRRHARHRQVRVERVTARLERLAGDDMDANPAADGHVQTLRKWRPTRVRLDLDVVTGERHAIEVQPAYRGQDRGSCSVLEDEAEPVLL